MNRITVIGLGNYGLDELPYGIYKMLTQSDQVYVRTLKHPVVEELNEIKWISFDEVYEAHDQFGQVYEDIVHQLIEASKTAPVLYAVPGHPMVAETTTQLLLQSDADVTIYGGKSFIDDLFTAAEYDPNDGFMMCDATAIDMAKINIRNALIVTQVYDQLVAGDLKVSLMEKYPDDHPVIIITGARSGQATKRQVPLYELDHEFEQSNLTSLFIPAVNGEGLYGEFETLDQVLQKLVGPDGCPWDKEQTHQSLKRYLIEESYELMEAIDEDDIDHMIEELGDVLMIALMHSAIGRKEEMFDSREVIAGITDKMIRRHPHVFGDAEVNTMDELHEVWNKEKANEGKVERPVKIEKQFADLFMKLYDAVQNGQTLEEAVKEIQNEIR